MKPTSETYDGHRIELRPQAADSAATADAAAADPGDLELLVDDEPVPYAQLPTGLYYLRESAYEWSEDLLDLARRLVDYRERR